MKLKRISDKEIHKITGAVFDLTHESIAQAQLEALEKEVQEKVGEIFEELERHRGKTLFDSFGSNPGRNYFFYDSDLQALKQKILGGLNDNTD